MFPEQLIPIYIIAAIATAVSVGSALIALVKQSREDRDRIQIIIKRGESQEVVSNLTEEEMNEIIRNIYMIKAKGVGVSK